MKEILSLGDFSETVVARGGPCVKGPKEPWTARE